MNQVEKDAAIAKVLELLNVRPEKQAATTVSLESMPDDALSSMVTKLQYAQELMRYWRHDSKVPSRAREQVLISMVAEEPPAPFPSWMRGH